MKLRSYIVCFFIIYSLSASSQQVDSLKITSSDSLQTEAFSPVRDSLFSDSLSTDKLFEDKTFTDSIPFRTTAPKEVKISDDAFDGSIDWGAKDTMWFDKKNNMVHLYGSAYVNYESLKLNAGYIAFDFDKNEALAIPLIDSLGNEIEPPTFEDGSQTFRATRLRYNFKSRKGMVYDAIKKEGELFVHGAVTKYISKEADTLNHVETIYAQNGIITSCDADHPHFGIRSKKLKVVPNKLAVLGFSILEIADIPTPLMLPFGFYPMFKDQRSGLILPNDYVFNDNLGYGFNGIGVYFPINDYYDLKLTADIYTRGSWGLNLNSNYKKRYKYNGNVALSYFNARTETIGQLEKTSSHKFSIRVAHNQDPKAHPYQKFGGSISLTLNGYDQTFYTDAANRLNNITRSNFTYSNSLPSSIFSVTAGLEHTQNTQSGKISVTFPVTRLNMKTYFPFKSKKGGGKENWYEKISISYNADAKNLIEATDSTLFDATTFQNAKYGLKHSTSSRASFNVLKYFTLTPSVNYNEIYFFKEREVSFDPEILLDSIGTDADGTTLYDTIYGQVVLDTVNTFKPFRDFSSSISMSTKQYGKILFSKGWLRGVRHVINYNVGFNYSPNTKKFYEVEIDSDGRDDYEDLERYNIFVRGPYGQGSPRIQQMAINYNISNNVEGKFYSRRDSSTSKVSLIKSLRVSGNYNFAADSLKFSQIRLSASTSFFKNLITIKYSGTLDPYMETSSNRRINTYVWDEKKRPFRHEASSLDINSTFTYKQISDLLFPQKKKEGNSASPDLKQKSSIISILETFRIRYDFGMTWKQDGGIDTFYVDRHVISTQGNIKLTKNWNLRIGHIGYDLIGKSITYPDLGFERNLHCWTMNFSWRPRAGQYSFYIGVRSTTLEFLKYRHGQSALESSLGSF